MNPVEMINAQNYPLHQTSRALENLTPLMFAAKYGLSDYIADQLNSIEDGKAELLAKTNVGGLTPLHYACLYGHVETVKVLLQHRASNSIASKLGQLPIHSLFSQHNNSEKIIEIFTLLCKDKPSLSAVNHNGDNVAHLAAQKGIVDILKYIYMIEPGFLNKKNSQAMTPLLLSVLNNQSDATDYLLSVSEKTITDNQRRNALHYAALYSTPDILKITLPHFSVSAVDANQKKPIDYAIAKKNSDKIHILEEAEVQESQKVHTL